MNQGPGESQGPAGSQGPSESQGPVESQGAVESPWPGEDEWPDDEDRPDDYLTGLPWPAAAPVPPPGPAAPGPGHRLRRVLGPLAVAVLAAAAGAGIVLAFTGSSGGTPSAGSANKSPRYLAPGSSAGPAGPGQGSSGQGGPGQAGGVLPGSGAATLFLIGTVTAVSATSITIEGAGPAVTATVTPSTRISGRVASISGIKVGDQVSALITRNGSRATATAIAYPPQSPGGAGAP